ncbi:MAG TPA: MFS transporter [Acidimicrobiales bacterium]|nr:MFS transporter [Acidimicrobiales bacterium]
MTLDAHADSMTRSRSHSSGFWTVAYVLLIVMAFATMPSPLYGIYRIQDHLSALTITIVFAIFAAGTITALLAVPRVARAVGRRGEMLAAVTAMMAGAGLLAAWKDLAVLLIARLLTGVGTGLAAGTAITYLIELRLRADPTASIVTPRTVGTSITVGGLGVGPLLAGCLAEWASWPLTLPYLVFLGLGAVGLAGLLLVPETSPPVRGTAFESSPRTRSARLPVPAGAGTLSAFAASGLFAGLAGLILAQTFGHTSHALAGSTLALVFTCGVVSQLATSRLGASRVLALGAVAMLAGLAALAVSVRLPSSGLGLFLVSGALIGAGLGAVFKGTTGIVLGVAAPQDRLAMTSKLLIALYVGLSIPVVGAGIALRKGATIANTVLAFAILVALGVSISGALLLRRPAPGASPPAESFHSPTSPEPTHQAPPSAERNRKETT